MRARRESSNAARRPFAGLLLEYRTSLEKLVQDGLKGLAEDPAPLRGSASLSPRKRRYCEMREVVVSVLRLYVFLVARKRLQYPLKRVSRLSFS